MLVYDGPLPNSRRWELNHHVSSIIIILDIYVYPYTQIMYIYIYCIYLLIDCAEVIYWLTPQNHIEMRSVISPKSDVLFAPIHTWETPNDDFWKKIISL